MSSLHYLYTSHPQSKSASITYAMISTKHLHRYVNPLLGFCIPGNQILYKHTPVTFSKSSNQCLVLIARCKNNISAGSFISDDVDDDLGLKKYDDASQVRKKTPEKSFWGAVCLIIGTAIGPGILGLPAATIRSGPLPSTISIILSWVYVISSIILVAELSFAAMEEDNVAEVSFTGLATRALGNSVGSFVALVYASLSFSLLVACISGIGSIVSQLFPWLNSVIAHAFFLLIVGIVIWFFPFKAIDSANRFLCVIMLFSMMVLVAIGLSVGRMDILSSFARASWDVSSVLPAIPVTVLTLGFHVITPFVCKIAGYTINDARKAILFGGVVPLIMVLLWNLIVLGLARTNTTSSPTDPISLLLSVKSSALSTVRSFAFSALATSLIGYAVSFPKQVVDTLELIFVETNSKPSTWCEPQTHSIENDDGKVGFVTYSVGHDRGYGYVGKISYGVSRCTSTSDNESISDSLLQHIVTPLVLFLATLIASFFHSSFSKALDFAGIYANCFLFGILPPLMAYISISRKKLRSSVIQGGNASLILLFSIAVVLGIWH